jgi:hypothetical protein
MRDGLVVFAPFAGFGDGLGFRGAEAVAIFGRNHGFEEMNHGGKLAGVQALQQFHGVLLVVHGRFSRRLIGNIHAAGRAQELLTELGPRTLPTALAAYGYCTRWHRFF